MLFLGGYSRRGVTHPRRRCRHAASWRRMWGFGFESCRACGPLLVVTPSRIRPPASPVVIPVARSGVSGGSRETSPGRARRWCSPPWAGMLILHRAHQWRAGNTTVVFCRPRPGSGSAGCGSWSASGWAIIMSAAAASSRRRAPALGGDDLGALLALCLRLACHCALHALQLDVLELPQRDQTPHSWSQHRGSLGLRLMHRSRTGHRGCVAARRTKCRLRDLVDRGRTFSIATTDWTASTTL